MLPPNETFYGALQKKGVNRRRFMKFCAAMTATLALPPRYVAQVASALEKTKKPVLVWLQFQDCAGNSEAILRSSHPSVLEVVLDLLSWEYHEIIMAGAGHQAEAALQRVVKEEKGKYLAVVEGCYSPGRRRSLLHGCGEDGVVNREGSLHERSGNDRGWSVRLVWRTGGCVPESDGSGRDFGGGAGSQGHQSGRMPAESREYGSGFGPLPDFWRTAGGGSVQPAAVCLWTNYP